MSTVNELNPFFQLQQKLYRTTWNFVQRLARTVPEFYSDWSLFMYCFKNAMSGTTQPRPILFEPDLMQHKLELVEQWCQLDQTCWGVSVQEGLCEQLFRLILPLFTIELPGVSSHTLLSRLSFASPGILVFPQPPGPGPYPTAAFSDLCVYFAQQLLRQHGTVIARNVTCHQQLERLAGFGFQPRDRKSLPTVLSTTGQNPAMRCEWFEAIEAGALQLRAPQPALATFSPDPQRTLCKAFAALSAALAADPPFPNLFESELQVLTPTTPLAHAVLVEPQPPTHAEPDAQAVAATHSPQPETLPASVAIPKPHLPDTTANSPDQSPSPPIRLRVRRDLPWPENV